MGTLVSERSSFLKSSGHSFMRSSIRISPCLSSGVAGATDSSQDAGTSTYLDAVTPAVEDSPLESWVFRVSRVLPS
jgi:hypothetical protein